MKTTCPPLTRGVRWLGGATLAFAVGAAHGADSNADAFPNFESYIKLSGQVPTISGNRDAYEGRAHAPADGSVGIEDFHYGQDTAKTSLTLDGRALAGSEDYFAKFHFTRNDVGSIEFGYQTFRTFYDGVGGFFPLNSEWLPLRTQELFVDRGKFWVEAVLARPNAPVITIRYTNETRSGQKDSTIWGDTDFTGLPNNNPPISQVRKIVPAYLNLHEVHENLELAVKHTIGKTTLNLTLLGDDTHNRDTNFVTRFPDETRPFPAPPATLLLPAAQMNNQIIQSSTTGMRIKTGGVIATGETVLTDQLTLRAGIRYEQVRADDTGDRPLVTNTPTATGPVQVTTYTYQNLVGSSRVQLLVGNVSLTYAPTANLSVMLAVKDEQEYTHSDNSYLVVAASGTPATTVTTTPRIAWVHSNENGATPELEVRYSGFKDLALYANASVRNVHGTENDTSDYNPLTATVGTPADNHVSENHGNYTVGANWRASAKLTVRAELFDKNHQIGTVGIGPALGDYNLIDNRFAGGKATVIWQPSAEYTFTTRYIYQRGRMKVTGFLPTYPAFDSCDARNQTISETVDWNPSPHFYAQVNANLVFNSIGTIYPRAGIAPASGTNIAWDVNQVLQNSDNNNLTASLLCGTVLNKSDDLRLQATYYRADNADTYLAFRTLPFGVAARDFTVTVGLKHKFNDRMLGDAKVGYFDSVNDTTGGHTNFRGPMGYLALVYAL